MSEVEEFFHMGGYAWYVWPSFLITLVVLLANVWISRRQFHKAWQNAQRTAQQKRKRQSQS